DQRLVHTNGVENRQLVASVHTPAIVRLDRAERARTGVALIHRDDVEVVREGLQRLERQPAPEVDGRVQAAWRQQQQSWPRTVPVLLVVDGRAPALNSWHVTLLHSSCWPSHPTIRGTA